MKIGPAFAFVFGLLFMMTSLGANPPVRSVRAEEMLAASLHFSDAYWDEATGLLWSAAAGEERRVHRVRESAWYALGLLMRKAPGDEARALRIVDRVLARQFTAPGEAWDGTFHRAPEEPLPGPGAQLWKNFDPNWRQFIGTTFALMLEEHEARLPAELRSRMLESIRRAVEGELTQGRAEPYHTNVKLMQGFLLGWAGRRLNRADWVARSEEWIGKIRADFGHHETFEEYNSPTYYGVDFYGLALCRRYGATEKIRTAAAQMEAGLWRDVGRFYHAGLKNMCGPFDRAYGMDMRRYVSLTGAWMGLVLPGELTPLPDPTLPMDHGHDFVAVPLYVALGAEIPEEVLAGFRKFQTERVFNRVISPERTATAWIAADLMLGGEVTQRTRDAGPETRFQQFVPATAHWRIGTGDVGTFALKVCPPVNAKVTANRLSIDTDRGNSTFRISAPEILDGSVTREKWALPGLSVTVETDAAGFEIRKGEGFVDVTYRDATRFDLRTNRHP